ncbi:MAG: Rne/Rng family ribonuclease [Clostridia bacterium]|nr:Rne/Rng family ribonuclease [Clostridia bacterium]
MSKKTLYFDKVLGYDITAATENGKLVDCDIEKSCGTVAKGNIYRGVIKNVLDGMQAAFVDCGAERNFYIPAEDLSPWCEGLTLEKHNFKAGDRVTVQVVKPPAGSKGAKVTARLSFVGKTIIYLPDTEFVGVSHKITDKELRASLIMEAKRAKRKGEGVVIRSAAPFCTYDHIIAELNYLRRQYEVYVKGHNGEEKGLIYADCSLPMRVLRDSNTDDVEHIVIGKAEIWDKLQEILPLLPDSGNITTELYAGSRDMLEAYGVAGQILSSLSPRVNIEGGANLVIEHTEALTVIDVNTGKYVGDDNLEQTVYHTNLAAAREIARQVKLRNIGGIVVVDFIDMHEENHRKALTYELNKALQKDSAHCKVLPMSEFGLIEFTRRRTGGGLSNLITTCEKCGGKGYAASRDAILISLRAEILKLLSGGAEYVIASADAETCEYALANRQFADDLRERFPLATIAVKYEPTHERGFTCSAVKYLPKTDADIKILY